MHHQKAITMVVAPHAPLHGSAVASLVFGLLSPRCCVSDFRTRRIPNSLVLVIAATGIALLDVGGACTPGLLAALGGIGVGFAIWFPFFLLRMLGRGT
jgi:prepilin peptidase CpaA